MAIILHLIDDAALVSFTGSEYRGDTLDTEGFIHCSTREQVVEVANHLFAGRHDLSVMIIDEVHVMSPIRYEDAGNGTFYPHIYGPLNRSAIIDIRPYRPDETGAFSYVPG